MDYMTLCKCLSSHAASASVVITSDQGIRGGKVIPLKETVDEAVRGLDYVRRIYIARRTGAAVNMQEGRDLQLQEVRYNSKPRKTIPVPS